MDTNRSNKPSDASDFVKPDISALEISSITFKKYLDMTVDMVTSMGIGKKDMMPVVTVYYRVISDTKGMLSDVETAIFGIGAGFNEDREKRKLMFGIGVSLFDKQMLPAAVFMSSEAWIATAKIGEKLPGRPSDCPDRKEVLMISGRSVDGEDKAIIGIPVDRDDGGLMQKADEQPISAHSSQNIYTNLLDMVLIGFQVAATDKFRSTLDPDVIAASDAVIKRFKLEGFLEECRAGFKIESMNQNNNE
jgi:hypothetical protein